MAAHLFSRVFFVPTLAEFFRLLRQPVRGVAGILSEDLHRRPNVEHDFRLGGVGKRAVDGRDCEEVVVQRIELAENFIKKLFSCFENVCLCVKFR